jgi:hypothetical protein
MRIRCHAVSLSHTLQADCFHLFDVGPTMIRLDRESERAFTVTIDANAFAEAGSEHLEYHAHISASCMLVALNIATMGYFTWRQHPSLHPIYEVLPDDGSPPNFISLSATQPAEFPIDRELTAADVERAVIIYRPIVNDAALAARTEYIKGLLHLGASHLDVNFYREAFGNYYRCMENCVTQKILNVRGLSNEVADIRRALESIGADETLQDAFRQVYALRSSQVAHAQRLQEELTFDNVLAAKAFADLVMYKTYRKIAEEMRSP